MELGQDEAVFLATELQPGLTSLQREPAVGQKEPHHSSPTFFLSTTRKLGQFALFPHHPPRGAVWRGHLIKPKGIACSIRDYGVIRKTTKFKRMFLDKYEKGRAVEARREDKEARAKREIKSKLDGTAEMGLFPTGPRQHGKRRVPVPLVNRRKMRVDEEQWRLRGKRQHLPDGNWGMDIGPAQTGTK